MIHQVNQNSNVLVKLGLNMQSFKSWGKLYKIGGKSEKSLLLWFPWQHFSPLESVSFSPEEKMH